MIRRQSFAHSRPKRTAYTLIELTVAMSLATLLMLGLSSALLISTRAFDGERAAQMRSQAADVQADLLTDLQQATGFTTKTATSVTFTVPDRDGDANEETISYDWDSGNANLDYTYNGSPAETLLTDVNGFDLNYLSRSLTGSTPAPPALDPNTWGTRWLSDGGIVFESFAQQKVDPKASDVIIAPPAGTAEGDLLIAAVVTDGDQSASLAATTGWNLIVVEPRWTAVTFGVWWRIASASEPGGYKFSWSKSEEAYGWVMRFTGHDAVSPINDWAVLTTGSGDTLNPPSPAVTTTVNNAMILRLGGYDDDDINVGSPGLPGHTVINMDKSSSGNGTASGGSGYVLQATAGDSGQSTFTLTAMEQTVAVTIAIAPDPS